MTFLLEFTVSLMFRGLTYSAPADEVVGVWILHQGPQLSQKSWNIAGIVAIYAHGAWRLLHAHTCPLSTVEANCVFVSMYVCMCIRFPD